MLKVVNDNVTNLQVMVARRTGEADAIGGNVAGHLNKALKKFLNEESKVLVNSADITLILNEVKKVSTLQEQIKALRGLTLEEKELNRGNATDIVVNECGLYKVPYKGKIELLDNRELDEALDLLHEQKERGYDQNRRSRPGTSGGYGSNDSKGGPSKKRAYDGNLLATGRVNRYAPPQSPDQTKVIRTFQTVIRAGKAEGASRSDVLAAKLADAKLQTKVEHKIDKCQRFKQVRGGFLPLEDGEDCEEELLCVKTMSGRILPLEEAREAYKAEFLQEVYRA